MFILIGSRSLLYPEEIMKEVAITFVATHSCPICLLSGNISLNYFTFQVSFKDFGEKVQLHSFDNVKTVQL